MWNNHTALAASRLPPGKLQRDREGLNQRFPNKSVAGKRERIKRAMSFLAASKDLDPRWFVPDSSNELENIRVADDLLVDLLFAANGQTYESVQPYVRELNVEGVRIRVLNIDGLLLTKTNYREKDLLDKQVLSRIKRDSTDNAN